MGWCGSAACCAESLPAFRKAEETDHFIVFLFLAAGPERLEPFRTAGGEAAILT